MAPTGWAFDPAARALKLAWRALKQTLAFNWKENKNKTISGVVISYVIASYGADAQKVNKLELE